MISRITIHKSSIELEVDKTKLRHLLTSDGGAGTFESISAKSRTGNRDPIRLTVEATLARQGPQVRLIVPSQGTGSATGSPAPSLIKAVARAYGWYEGLLQGKHLTQRSLAKANSLSERYVGSILEFAFLAPDVVELILQGRQPHAVTLQKLCRGLPSNWSQQRLHLGLSIWQSKNSHRWTLASEG